MKKFDSDCANFGSSLQANAIDQPEAFPEVDRKKVHEPRKTRALGKDAAEAGRFRVFSHAAQTWEEIRQVGGLHCVFLRAWRPLKFSHDVSENGQKMQVDGAIDLEGIPLSPMAPRFIYAAPLRGTGGIRRLSQSVWTSSGFWSKTRAHTMSANQGRLHGGGLFLCFFVSAFVCPFLPKESIGLGFWSASRLQSSPTRSMPTW